ncbi:Psilocybin synthase [Erysiphe necator]|nr:Psilocybin synthase [Erysiphe necator]
MSKPRSFDPFPLNNERHSLWYNLKPNGQLDFSDPNAVQQLTKSLLKRDFGVSVILPQDRLCPPEESTEIFKFNVMNIKFNVPNRLNYILWIQRLLDTTDSASFIDFKSTNENRYESKNSVVSGLDIGTGASCIYPILGCVLRSHWKLVGTDDKSLEYARQNVSTNHLGDRISIIKTEPQSPLIPFQALGLDQYFEKQKRYGAKKTVNSNQILV